MWWGNTPKSRSTEILIIRQRCAPHFTIVSSSETLAVSFLPLSGLAFQILHPSKVCEGTLQARYLEMLNPRVSASFKSSAG